MSKNLYFSYPDKNIHAQAELYWDNAPETCKALWDALETPLRIKGTHSMFVGPEVALVVPAERRSFPGDAIPPESQSCYPLAGEIAWFYQKPFARKGAADALWEIGVFYDTGARLFGPLGWAPGNIFGRIIAGLDQFAACCRSLRVEGTQIIEMRRA